MSHTTPAQQFGYLLLTEADEDKNRVLVKADKIVAIEESLDEEGQIYSKVSTTGSEYCAFFVKESTVQILDQLESIHPHMR